MYESAKLIRAVRLRHYPQNYLVYIRVTSITFLIKWFNAIFPELIPRFESGRKFYNNTFIAVPIIFNLG